MNPIEAVVFYKTKLNLLKKSSEYSLSKVNIEIDSFAKLHDKVPFILIEISKSKLKTASKGEAIGYIHDIDFYCVVSAHEKDFETYKTEAMTLAQNFIDAFDSIKDSRLRVIMREDELDITEIMIGSLKCSGVIVSKQIETKF